MEVKVSGSRSHKAAICAEAERPRIRNHYYHRSLSLRPQQLLRLSAAIGQGAVEPPSHLVV